MFAYSSKELCSDPLAHALAQRFECENGYNTDDRRSRFPYPHTTNILATYVCTRQVCTGVVRRHHVIPLRS